MRYNFNELPERLSTESIKWHAYGGDVLPMWVADMDFPSPQPVIEALQERVAHGVFGYPGEPEGLREAVVDWLAQRHAWQVSTEDLVFVPGVVTGVNMVAHAFAGAHNSSSGAGILIQPPVYMPFLRVPNNVGGQCQEAPLAHHPDGFYSIDWDAFEQAITPETRLFVLCNPHNPVGRVFSRPELERMAEICLRHNVLICSDEIHSDLVYSDHHHIPIASISPEVAQNTVTLIAPSKTFNLAGLGCSVAIISNPELRKQFRAAHLGLVHGVNILGLVAARAAYRHGQEWLDQLLIYLEENRDWLYHFVRHELPGVSMFKPEGMYLAWLDCREAGISENLCRFFTDQAGVALNDGQAFGAGGEGFVRLNFGCPRPMLEEALERMRAALLQKS